MNGIDQPISLSGSRFSVVYSLHGDENFAQTRADEIIVEQTIEFPAELVKNSLINDHIIGHIEDFQKISEDQFETRISYVIEETAFNFPQLFNVVYGNISMKTGIRVERLFLPNDLLKYYRGPRFGRKGIREKVGVHRRPLIGSAIKPMGLPTSEHAQMAYKYALGGLDVIKDDHGLNDLPYSAFKDRVARCADAIRSANAKTGFKTLYFPCVVAPFEKILDFAYFAKEAGAGGLMVIPGLTGFDSMRMLADQDDLNLPIMYHPAGHGSFFTSANEGFSKYAFFGQIMRLAGADVTIFPNFGARFPITRQECKEIADGSQEKMDDLKPIFPGPAGGLTFKLIPELIEVYDREMMIIIGGGIHREGPDLVANCRRLRDMFEKYEED
jgi:ribulose-bisphosphate carboxylase large chain